MPLGPQTHRFSARSSHSSVRSACWVAGDRRGLRVPGVEGLAGRQPGRAAAHPDRGLVAAGGLLGEQDPERPRRAPSAARRRSRAPPARRCARRAAAAAAASRSSSSGSGGGAGVLTVMCRTLPGAGGVLQRALLAARAGNAITCARLLVGEDRREVALVEAARRPPRASAWSTARRRAAWRGRRPRPSCAAPAPAPAAAARDQPRARRPARSQGTPARLGAARPRTRSSAPGGLGG